MGGLRPSIKLNVGVLEVVFKGRKGHSPKDWVQLKEERRAVDVGVGPEESTEKMVLEYQQRSHQSFIRLPSFQNPSDSTGVPLAPGLFLATFPPHGTHLVEVKSSKGNCQGIMVTGNPKDPRNQVFFIVEKMKSSSFDQVCPFVLPEGIIASTSAVDILQGEMALGQMSDVQMARRGQLPCRLHWGSLWNLVSARQEIYPLQQGRS